MSEQEKTEIYGQISEMVEEGTTPEEIADILEISPSDVRSICVDLGIHLPTPKNGRRSLTKEELKYYKKCRKKNEPIKAIAQRMGISLPFLVGLEKYLKLKIECRDCHTILKNRKGLYTRYCDPCRKQRISDCTVNRVKRFYRENEEYREKKKKYSREYPKRKLLT
jgi:DNA invertase Pin-like site-specific DNA recombinase